MRSHMINDTAPIRLLTITLAILIAALAPHANAQTKIPYELTTASTPLSPAHKQLIKSFTTPRVNHILAAEHAQLSQARQELLEPLNRAGVSNHFLQAYSSLLAPQLLPAARNPNPLVKLNALVLTATLVGPDAIELTTIGLADTNPAVRYWAAKAASIIPTRSTLTEHQQRTLLDALTLAIKAQPTDPVFEKLLSALAALNIPEASSQLLTALDLRLPLLAQDPSRPLGATVQSLQSIFITAVRRASAGQPATRPILRHLTLVSYRYFDLTATILDDASHPPAAQSQCIKLLDLANRVLPWAVAQLDPDAQLPPPIELQLAAKAWPEVRLRAEEWRHLLTADPFNFTLADLNPATTK